MWTPSRVESKFGAFPHEHDARNDVLVVDDPPVRAVDRPAELAEPDLGTLRDDGDVLDPDRRAVLRRDDRILDVLRRADQPDHAHIDLLHARLDEAAARVHVVVRKLLLHLADAEAVGDELVRVDAHLVFPRGTAEARYIDHVRHGLELFHQHPVLQGLQLHGVICGIRAFQGIEVDLADGAEVGADLGLKARREGHHGDALQDLLPVPGVVRIVVENKDHDGQPCERYGPQMGELGDAVHRVLEGDGDLLLHFLRGPARPLGDDPGVVVRHVRVGLHRKAMKGEDAPDKEQKRKGQHKEAFVQGEIDNRADHLTAAPWPGAPGRSRPPSGPA